MSGFNRLSSRIILTAALILQACSIGAQSVDETASVQSLLEMRCLEEQSITSSCELAVLMRDRNRTGVSEFIARAYLLDEETVPERVGRDGIDYRFQVAQPQNPNKIASIYIRYVEKTAWWSNPPRNPENYPEPLRAPAYIAESFAQLSTVDRTDEALAIATEAGNFLLESQRDAGGVIGFPDWRDKNNKLGEITRKVLTEAQRYGMEERVFRAGWVVEDPGEGSLYFDNGVVGEALIELYAATGDRRYLDGALRAVEWAQDHPIVANFNYNAFSAALLARASVLTNDRDMYEDAKARLEIGVLSAMKSTGPFAGHWVDSHNETLVYRMIMARALLITLDAGRYFSDDSDELLNQTILAVRAIEDELVAASGILYPESAVRLYCAMAEAENPNLRFSAQHMITFEQAVNANISQEKPTLSPAAIGCFLKSAVTQQ